MFVWGFSFGVYFFFECLLVCFYWEFVVVDFEEWGMVVFMYFFQGEVGLLGFLVVLVSRGLRGGCGRVWFGL